MTLPTNFKDKYTCLLGEQEATLFFASLETQEEQKGFRINPLKNTIDLDEYLGFPLTKAPFSQWGYLGSINGKSPLHQAGYVYSQEPSAMIVASVADVKPGDMVLDLCAAPGGKSTQLASQLEGKGLLVSNEIVPKRAKVLAENMERFGVVNSIITNHAPHELSQHFNGFFDKIIVDAPCSGEGMFRKDEGAIHEWSTDTPTHCAQRQKDILHETLKLLKHGGELTYSTCTFSPEENEEIVSWLVEQYPVELLPLTIPQTSKGRSEWGSVKNLDYTVRLWPHLNQGEGHFVAKLRFNGHNESNTYSPKQNDLSLNKEQLNLVRVFLKQFPLPFDYQLVRFGNNVWATPSIPFSLKGLRILRCGLHLGTLLKNRFEPSFALAMALSKPAQRYPHIQITFEQWKKYVNGETFSYDGNIGWVLLLYKDLTVGFGKLVQNTVKNFYPKGLRFKT